MNCPNCKTSAYMSKPWPASGRCSVCGWFFGGMPAEYGPAGGGGGAYRVTWYSQVKVVGACVNLGCFREDRPPAKLPRGVWSANGDHVPHRTPPVDPLDIQIDGVTLRDLLEIDQTRRREQDVGCIPWRNADPWTWTPAQHEAISAHWSAQLRAKVRATGKPELTVMVQVDCDE